LASTDRRPRGRRRWRALAGLLGVDVGLRSGSWRVDWDYYAANRTAIVDQWNKVVNR